MTEAEEFEHIYGPPAKLAEHQIGATITYRDPDQPLGHTSGVILYIVESTGTTPLTYVVSSARAGDPVEVKAADVIE